MDSDSDSDLRQRRDNGLYFSQMPSVLTSVDGFPIKETNPNIFDMYMSEADAHDSVMVERWKTAMEGLLIFVSD